MVGRLVEDPTLKETDNSKVCNLKIAITRPYKNSEGMYETDFIQVSAWSVIAEKICEYCKKGDLIGVRGRLSGSNKGLNAVAEKISFLSTSKNIKDDEKIEIDKNI